jgi:hypothetical protein
MAKAPERLDETRSWQGDMQSFSTNDVVPGLIKGAAEADTLTIIGLDGSRVCGPKLRHKIDGHVKWNYLDRRSSLPPP